MEQVGFARQSALVAKSIESRLVFDGFGDRMFGRHQESNLLADCKGRADREHSVVKHQKER